jgi:thiamine biosynthesis protein ThiC
MSEQSLENRLKIFSACEEVMRMDDLQLSQARKHFNWKYLRSSLEELRIFVKSIHDATCPECGEPYSGCCGPCATGKCQG